MKKYCFGVDVGGTTIKMGFFDTEGNVLDKWEIPTRTENGGENVLPDIAKAVKDKLAEKQIDKEEVSGIGVGVPGPVDSKGVVDVYLQVLGQLVDAGGQNGDLDLGRTGVGLMGAVGLDNGRLLVLTDHGWYHLSKYFARWARRCPDG